MGDTPSPRQAGRSPTSTASGSGPWPGESPLLAPYTAAARRARRFLETTKGQRAMAVAKIYPEPAVGQTGVHRVS